MDYRYVDIPKIEISHLSEGLVSIYKKLHNIKMDKTTVNRIHVNNDLKTQINKYSVERSPNWEANWFPASEEIPAFYETRRVITIFTTAHHLTLLWDKSMNPFSRLTTRIFILILSSDTRLGFPIGFFPSCFLIKTLYGPLLSSICATWPAHLIFLNFTLTNTLSYVLFIKKL